MSQYFEIINISCLACGASGVIYFEDKKYNFLI